MYRSIPTAALALACALAAPAFAADSYTVDPMHTYPSFEADHFGGLSLWRGKFNTTSGKITLDRKAGSGTVDITIDAASVDYGLDAMNEKARSEELFDTAKYPTATYKGKLAAFKNGAPTRVQGELTLHGVTRPVELKVNSFKCVPDPMAKRERCGADALATIKRDQFGMSAGKDYGFNMDVTLRIQVEAVKDE